MTRARPPIERSTAHSAGHERGQHAVGMHDAVARRSTSFEAAIFFVSPQLQRFAFRMTDDHAAAEDLIQDAVARSCAIRARFKTGTSIKVGCFASPVMSICQNCAAPDDRLSGFPLDHRNRIHQYDAVLTWPLRESISACGDCALARLRVAAAVTSRACATNCRSTRQSS